MVQFEALPLAADGSTRVPPALRRAIVDLALDVLNGPDSRARAESPAILRILTGQTTATRSAKLVPRGVHPRARKLDPIKMRASLELARHDQPSRLRCHRTQASPR